jgi:AcrR family transcriptional regulator
VVLTVSVQKAASLPSPQARRARNREEVVVAILAAARAVMRERGVAGLSFREVARRVGMRAPSLYEYFPSKTALYDALFLLAIQRYRATVDRLKQKGTSFWDRLRVGFEAYLTFATEHPDLYALAFERPVPGFVPSASSMAESARLLEGFQRIFVEAIDAGRIAPGVSASQARDLAIAVMHGLTAQHMANEPQLPPGSGRYGSLVPAALALFRASWEPHEPKTPQPESSSEPVARPRKQKGGRARKSEP